MKIPWWKKLASYLYEVHVESSSSEYNEELHVSLVDGRYQLTTPTAIYSWADKYDNFRLAFKSMKLDELVINEVLILGFGLGSIPYILEHTFQKKYSYTGVEIDDEVIYLASKYMMPLLNSEINLVHTDASSFIFIDPNRYDLITMDIFVGHVIPDAFLTENYLLGLKESLNDSGILLFNMLAQQPSDRSMAEVYFADHFKPVFPKGVLKHIKGNIMLVSNESALI